METLGQRIKRLREQRGWSQTRLAREVTRHGYKITQQGVSKIEDDQTDRPRGLREFALALAVREDDLREGSPQIVGGEVRPAEMPAVQQRANFIAEPVRSGAGLRMPLHMLEQGAFGLEMKLRRKPVRETTYLPGWLENVRGVFGVYVPDETMAPVLKTGNVIVVHPTRPVREGEECLFLSDEKAGVQRAVARELVKITDTEWRVRQHNPPREYDLPRSEWPEARWIAEIRR